jgi:hypothetical protein
LKSNFIQPTITLLATIKSGKALEWDPVAEKITNHPEAAAHLTGTYAILGT